MKNILILFIIVFTIQSAFTQNTATLPYPVIFVHGLNSNDLTWNDMKNLFEVDYKLKFGGRMDFCLNQDGNFSTSKLSDDYKDYTNTNEFDKIINGDFYTINFDVDNMGIPYNNLILSNQSAIVKQGKAVSDAIKHVLQITGKDKVILVGHSMGGLASREYLQNRYLWYEPNIKHHVAKLCTIGTPHGGSNESLGSIGTLVGPDIQSEAVRDLRTSYFYSYYFPFPNANNDSPGAYLFGGVEDDSYLKNDICCFYYNVDINCDGINSGDGITGLNKKTYPTNLAYSCAIGTNDILGGDGIVSTTSANINNFLDVNANLFYMPKTGFNLGIWHIQLTKQLSEIMKLMDEPDQPTLAYQISENTIIKGFITQQTVNQDTDVDIYKLIVNRNGNLISNIRSSPEAGLYKFEILNQDLNNVEAIECDGNTTLNVQLQSGIYYIRISGIASIESWDFPYHLTNQFIETIENPNTDSRNNIFYFIDNEKHFEGHIPIIINSKGVSNNEFNIDISNLPNGGHILFIKVVDSHGKSSFIQRQSFWKDVISVNQTVNLKRIEYFFDADPGINKGNVIPFACGKTADLTYTINLNNITNGGHTLYVRAIDNNGKLSFIQCQSFWKDAVSINQIPNLKRIEYFFDTDPGVNKGNAIPYSSEKNADVAYIIDLNNVANGGHTLYVRAIDQNGKSSFIQRQSFWKTQSSSNPKIVQIDYFIDAVFNANSINLSKSNQAPFIDTEFTVNLDVISGSHIIYVRAKDNQGKWSFMQAQSFCVIPNVTFTTDKDIYLQSDSIHFFISVPTNETLKFEWDFENNGNFIERTNKNTAYKYTQLGEHQINLRVTTFGGCSTIFSKTVTVTLSTVSNKLLTKTNDFVVFPNPSSGNFRIRIEQPNPDILVQIYTIDGKIIYNEKLNSKSLINEFKFLHLLEGLYFLRLSDNQIVSVKQIIIKNK